MTVTVKVGSAGKARSVQLFKETTDLWGGVSWTAVKKRRVAGRSSLQFTVVATDHNAERYRASVAYATGKPVTSRAARVTVWRWVRLGSFASYYSTPGTSSAEYSSFAMNGAQYKGWHGYGTYPTWESRHTPGRHCRAFRGDFGVTDSSADGSSAEITLVADETTIAWTSSRLTPGMVEQAEIALAMPYRISVQARNTSPDGVRAYPAIGHPELLCTGI